MAKGKVKDLRPREAEVVPGVYAACECQVLRWLLLSRHEGVEPSLTGSHVLRLDRVGSFLLWETREAKIGYFSLL